MKKLITFGRPHTFQGKAYDGIEMREPLVRDQRAAQAASPTEADRETYLFGALCEVPPAFFDDLPLKDYLSVQRAFMDFVG